LICFCIVEAAHPGHADIQNDEVRLQPNGFLDRFLPASGFGALELRAGSENPYRGLAYDFVIVGDQNSHSVGA
jgi:hypothetical protein